jgi:hypothetical protein
VTCSWAGKRTIFDIEFYNWNFVFVILETWKLSLRLILKFNGNFFHGVANLWRILRLFLFVEFPFRMFSKDYATNREIIRARPSSFTNKFWPYYVPYYLRLKKKFRFLNWLELWCKISSNLSFLELSQFRQKKASL